MTYRPSSDADRPVPRGYRVSRFRGTPDGVEVGRVER